MRNSLKMGPPFKAMGLSDLSAYFARLGLSEAPPRTLQGLAALHRAHASAIPFENLDIHLGKPIRIDLPSLERKLVAEKRGGYCFEQNSLFLAALESLGFRATALGARVRVGGRDDPPRTHMLLCVRADGRDLLCDVGFGGGGVWEPLPLEPAGEVRQGAWRFRVVEEDGERVLQSMGPRGWQDLYAFTLEPMRPSDLKVANHYTATHPDSGFVRTITAQLPGPAGALVLRGKTLSTLRPGKLPVAVPAPKGEDLLVLLKERFGLSFPKGTRFRAPYAA